MKLPFNDSELFLRATVSFDRTALEVYAFQYENCETYRSFSDSLRKNPNNVKTVGDIPFLPVEFFKTQKIYSSNEEPQALFTSSGTTGTVTSTHYVRSLRLYEESLFNDFIQHYGDPKDFIFLFLLPSYLERDGSSLVYMCEQLRQASVDEDTLRGNPDGTQSFYLHSYAKLAERLKELNQYSSGKKVMLIGVTYALLDLAEQFPMDLSNVVIMETGGMKGKRKEITREELHTVLKKAFNVASIHSEYGMTELLSQGYSKGKGIFTTPPWMRIMIREANDPLSWAAQGKTGGVSIIDLANVYSCSFISTSDLGKILPDGSFEILGRFDFSDTRGCNLLYVD